MYVKVLTAIYLEVDDHDKAEYACGLIDAPSGLQAQMEGFPAGEVLGIDVDHFEEVTEAELSEKGLTEE